MNQSESKKVFLDLGCGVRKRDGFLGIDRRYFKGVDLVADVDKSLPFKDNVIGAIYSNYFLEHTTDLLAIFQEIYRVCKDGAIVEFIVPYYTSINAFKDPTHKQFFTEETFRYFTQDKWYGSDYNIGTNFKIEKIKYHYSKIVLILYPFRRYLRRHFLNMAGAMTVILKVVKHND